MQQHMSSQNGNFGFISSMWSIHFCGYSKIGDLIRHKYELRRNIHVLSIQVCNLHSSMFAVCRGLMKVRLEMCMFIQYMPSNPR